MQPFDGGTFDRRYEEVFAPAIRASGLEPYRVDQDPSVSIPIQDIERGIRDSQLCLAEITLDNPNVWFELGYAISAGKEVVLVCSDERATKFPFDVQHRSILTYKTKSISDYERLGKAITGRITAYLKRAETVSSVAQATKLTKFDGLDQFEVVALATIAQNFDHPEDHASPHQIKRDMEASGFTRLAATLALRSLSEKGLVTVNTFHEYQSGDPYLGYSISESGWTWVLANKDKFALKRENPEIFPDIPF
ncbi:hypothetical protein [uncultured Aquimonas sp.]|uniref:hypothetical protein n=1 Tax=uncultured Aquimonas sp. TaxID=385483 RepID=UPI00262DA914|nr:hypothetical protein [uncultured Aquimonas sp.]